MLLGFESAGPAPETLLRYVHRVAARHVHRVAARHVHRVAARHGHRDAARHGSSGRCPAWFIGTLPGMVHRRRCSGMLSLTSLTPKGVVVGGPATEKKRWWRAMEGGLNLLSSKLLCCFLLLLFHAAVLRCVLLLSSSRCGVVSSPLFSLATRGFLYSACLGCRD
ncbi:hypothetical protein ABKV19_025644 [Rosa sericea]